MMNRNDLHIHPNHRHVWKLEQRKQRMVIYRCTGCRRVLFEMLSNLVLDDDGELKILSRQQKP